MELSPRQQAQAANLRTHLTEGEISDLLELARKTDPRAWAIFALSFNHGLRVTEVPNLRLDGENCSFEGQYDHYASARGDAGKPALSEVSALRAYLKVRIEDGSGKLFTGQKGPLRRWTLTRIFRSFCEQVSQSRVQRGMQPIAANAMHFHSLKH
jgi:integrase